MVLIGIDYGEVRTGVAMCDPMGILASPVAVISGVGKRKLAAQLCELAREKKAEKFILGLPLRTDGSRGDKAIACEALAALLHAQAGLEVVLWDERFSTAIAHQHLGSAGIRAKNRKDKIDAAAAVVILQSYLDRK